MIPKPDRINKKRVLQHNVSHEHEGKNIFLKIANHIQQSVKKESRGCDYYEIPADFYIEINKLILQI